MPKLKLTLEIDDDLIKALKAKSFTEAQIKTFLEDEISKKIQKKKNITIELESEDVEGLHKQGVKDIAQMGTDALKKKLDTL